jgi:hypothetical protein
MSDQEPARMAITVDVLALARIHNACVEAVTQLRILLDVHTADLSGVALAAEAAAESAIREADQYSAVFGRYLDQLGGAV